jgi:hypothetical protein
MHRVEHIAQLSDILGEFTERAHGMVWANLATLGYDPADFFGSFDRPNFGLMKLGPYRVEVTNWPVGTKIWRRDR